MIIVIFLLIGIGFFSTLFMEEEIGRKVAMTIGILVVVYLMSRL